MTNAAIGGILSARHEPAILAGSEQEGRTTVKQQRRAQWLAWTYAALWAVCVATAYPQDAPPAPTPQSTPPPASSQPGQQGQSTDQARPDQGGPDDDNGVIVLPKRQDTPPPPPPAPAAPVVTDTPGLTTNYALRVDAPVVNVDVGVFLEQSHEFVSTLQKANFRVFEDGQPQVVTHFSRVQVPITAVLLLEFAANNYSFIYDMRNAAFAFTNQLHDDDYVAVLTYDLHTEILTDFTQDKRLVDDALGSLTMPTWRETNMFDALYQTLDRLTRVDGRKYIILVSSGQDSFSKIDLDQMLAKIKATPNVTIFTIGTGQLARILGESRMGGMHGAQYLQGDNELTTFARLTGGGAYFPRFQGEMPDIFREINACIRSQYLLTYAPTNSRQDGSYRHIEVELVDDEGKPLRMQDQKHRPLKYDVVARDGYRARLPVQ